MYLPIHIDRGFRSRSTRSEKPRSTSNGSTAAVTSGTGLRTVASQYLLLGINDPDRIYWCYKIDPELPSNQCHFGGAIATKVLGHYKLQDPLHLAVQVHVRRSRF
jgi:hypothetical protein